MQYFAHFCGVFIIGGQVCTYTVCTEVQYIVRLLLYFVVNVICKILRICELTLFTDQDKKSRGEKMKSHIGFSTVGEAYLQ